MHAACSYKMIDNKAGTPIEGRISSRRICIFEFNG
jgi:hypothetical protein